MSMLAWLLLFVVAIVNATMLLWASLLVIAAFSRLGSSVESSILPAILGLFVIDIVNIVRRPS